ncbi:MAG: ABC transporter permease [Cyclobacteriaceae bacterium]
MKQLFAFIHKEFLHVFRDPKTMLLLFGLPIAQILLFGFALSNEINHSSVIVIDHAKDASSRSIIEKIRASENFDLYAVLNDHDEIEETFKRGETKMAIVFPSNFNQDLIHSGYTEVQLITDASDPNTATTLVNYFNMLLLEYQMEMNAVREIPMNIELSLRNIYNPELEGTTNFVPGVMALVLLLVCVLMTSVAIVKEKELGTMEILLVSPFNPLMVIISKVIPYLFLSIINLIVILTLSVFVLDLQIAGSILLLFGVSILLILAALSLGILISNVTNNQQTAMLISLMAMLLPTLMFTGFMFPIENMPKLLQLISNIIPSTWYYIIVKNVMIKGLGFESIWKESLILAGMTVFLLLVSIKKFKIRLS